MVFNSQICVVNSIIRATCRLSSADAFNLDGSISLLSVEVFNHLFTLISLQINPSFKFKELADINFKFD